MEISESVNYMLVRNNDNKTYYMVKDPYSENGKPDYSKYIGKAIVRKINTSKAIIEIDIQDVKVINENQVERKIRGMVSSPVIIREYKP